MNVHIVCTVRDEQRILARMAQTLADQTGWTLAGMPRRDADFNYFVPYLDWTPCDTLSGAYFSHYDDQMAGKAKRWQQAGQAADLRVITARQYERSLAAFGTTVIAPPPLDRNRFTPSLEPRTGTRRVVAGVAGYVYQDGRKGEDLIQRLVKETRQIDWRAIGRGWAIPTLAISDDLLPSYYRSLDLFVCASRVEGVPYPPLEALACGVPVVIPRGVGLLDDLPNLPGIYRFKAGNYDSLKEAVHLAYDAVQTALIDRAALREATAPYTARTWAQTHERAIERLIMPSDTPPLPTPTPANSGMYLVAFGAPARLCAVRCIQSWHTFMPGYPVTVVSGAPFEEGVLDERDSFIQQPDYDIGARKAKLSIDRLAPAEWQYVLYLDADTELVAPVPFLFEALGDGYELVITRNPGKYVTTRMMVRPDNKQEVDDTYRVMGYDDMIQFNGGVFSFRRSPRTAAFFEDWISEWMKEAKRDQAALLRALWSHPLKLYLLGNEWNKMDEYCADVVSAGILHHQREARRVKQIIWSRGDSPEAFKQMNQKP